MASGIRVNAAALSRRMRRLVLAFEEEKYSAALDAADFIVDKIRDRLETEGHSVFGRLVESVTAEASGDTVQSVQVSFFFDEEIAQWHGGAYGSRDESPFEEGDPFGTPEGPEALQKTREYVAEKYGYSGPELEKVARAIYYGVFVNYAVEAYPTIEEVVTDNIGGFRSQYTANLSAIAGKVL